MMPPFGAVGADAATRSASSAGIQSIGSPFQNALMSSIVARRGIAGSTVYSATKAAQAGLVEALRAEWLGTPLRASVVFPISTATEFHDAIRRDYGFEIHGRGPKQSAGSVAEAVLRCIDHPRAEVYPYGVSRALAVLNILAPSLADRVVQRFSRRKK